MMSSQPTRSPTALAAFACAASLALAAGLFASSVSAAPLAVPFELEARAVKHPERAAILALASAGKRSIAAGERGIVALSDDAGKSWRQAKVPVSVTLTAMSFIDERRGWAVGHAGVVLRTSDGGSSWVKLADGRQLAAAAVAEAQKNLGGDAGAPDARLKAARQLVEDGADKPLLDVSFSSDSNGVVVGAYGLAFATTDGGATWTSLMSRIDNPKGHHLNAVRTSGDITVIVGEQGAVYRSEDGLRSFSKVPLDFRGSLFTLSLLPTGEIATGGIKGNVFISGRDGRSDWRRIELPIPAGVVSLTPAADGSLLMGSQAGVVFRKRVDSDAADPVSADRLPLLTAVLPSPDGALILAALQGLRRVEVLNRSKP